MRKKGWALALAGGGAKGAYQVGVLETLFEAGFEFSAVVGTSIGALNGVLIAQEKFDECKKLWRDISFNKVLGFDDEIGAHLAKKEFKLSDLKYFFQELGRAISKNGVSKDYVFNLIKSNVDEKKLRRSKIKYGLMTYSMSKRKPVPVFVEDIPEGKIADYIMASASFPGVQRTVIDDEWFIDGGIYDNLPINMLIDKGYRNIIAIKAGGKAREQKVRISDDINLLYIDPSEQPGRLLDFRQESIERAMKVGNLDGQRFIKNFKGRNYYIDVKDISSLSKKLQSTGTEKIKKMCEIVELRTDREKICLIVDLANHFAKLLGVYEYSYIAEVYITFLEEIARIRGVERLQILTVDEFISSINNSKPIKKRLSRQEKLFESLYTQFLDLSKVNKNKKNVKKE